MVISSPLRYPGGKGKMYKQVKQFIIENDLLDKVYTEPFAGGFGIGVKLLTNQISNHVIINDYDFHIYAIWYCIFNETEKFIDLISNIEVDLSTWQKQKQIYNNFTNYSILEVGLSAFFLNRTNYSGVLKGGPIGGTKQTGKYKIDCRFNKKRLIHYIDAISQYRDKVELYNYDVGEFINKVILKRKNELFINFDPPYVTKGEVLYKNYFNEEDHKALANRILSELPDAKWIMTYDDCELIRTLYKKLDPQKFNLTYFAGTKRTGNELFITNIKK